MRKGSIGSLVTVIIMLFLIALTVFFGVIFSGVLNAATSGISLTFMGRLQTGH